MFTLIDNILDKITMYRVVLYLLCFLLAAALVLGAFGILPYSPIAIIYSLTLLIAVCWLVNTIFAKLFKVTVGVESVYITALILALIISPPQSGEYFSILPFIILAGSVAMASKFLVNIGKKHLFNPAAFAVLITALVIGQSASWWVGTLWMLPFVLVAAGLMWRKFRQLDLPIAFVLAASITTIIVASMHDHVWSSLYRSLIGSPLVFFAAIMLTEPMTMPPNRDGRIAYGILVGMLFNPQAHLGSLYFTPEMALLIGNLFAYTVSPKGRHVFTVKKVNQVGSNIYNFVLQADRQLKFKAGQYMEWTLGHPKPDTRGNRRFFTLASSPTETETILGVRFYDQPSSFKKHLSTLKPGNTIIGAQLAGDFTLPEDPQKKLVFIAGGIGVTPYRSMIKYLLDQNEKRDIILMYSNRRVDEISYVDIFKQAEDKLDIKTVYTLTEPDGIPSDWSGRREYINETMIKQEVADYQDRQYYISGSHGMVTATKELLLKMGIPRRQIKTDFFPGLA